MDGVGGEDKRHTDKRIIKAKPVNGRRMNAVKKTDERQIFVMVLKYVHTYPHLLCVTHQKTNSPRRYTM